MSTPQGSPEPYVDPSGNTEAFQAFVRRGGVPDQPPVAAKKSSMGLIVGIVVVAVVVIAVVIWLLS